MTSLQIVFNENEVSNFLERIEVKSSSNLSIDYLKNIVAGIIEHIPFQNVTMLTNEWKRPSEKMIKMDMLSGVGGLCTVRNPFLHEFLKHLGFNVYFVSSTINEPDCHISLIVHVDGADWWIDVGNGFPYLEPIRLGDESIKSNWFMSYRLKFDHGRYYVCHKLKDRGWEINHHFSNESVNYSIFDRMHHLHYSVPGWGPFLTGLRINRFWQEGAAVIRDEVGFSPTGWSDLNDIDKLRSWLSQWFKKSGFIENIDLESANKIWKREQVRCKDENNNQ
tara:strand:+ start:475 stop:1308 length:834 start_codon:yes stop_codon:yes gene_type:complete